MHMAFVLQAMLFHQAMLCCQPQWVVQAIDLVIEQRVEQPGQFRIAGGLLYHLPDLRATAKDVGDQPRQLLEAGLSAQQW